ncbi:MAG: hypothetical protein GF416_03235 [Candidatus Altiarchaeales archaeon]|nr:hypothetical protein [Candidatus Altiarchaeales archaeon]MBD3416133.1 hypothetical protein [Candidatus Altiarchaeales archaeon]
MLIRSDRGMMGIGTLIIFIAIILVAAVAASVLISTSGSLQQRSLTTGSQAEEGVATGVEVLNVMGTDGSTGHDLEDFEMIMKLQAGSQSINLNNTLLLVDTSTTSQSLNYGGNVSDDVLASNTQVFVVTYTKEGPDFETDYLSRGDVLKVKFKCYECTGSNDVGGIAENKKVRTKIIPRVGSSTIVEFTTPDVVTDRRITLWP